MPTKHPRLNIVLEPPILRSVERLAAQEGISLSMKARDLIRQALELHEDAYWARQAQSRMRTFRRNQALTHERVWSKSSGKKA